MHSKEGLTEVTYTFQFGIYHREAINIELVDMPCPSGKGWQAEKQLVANGFRMLKVIRRSGPFFKVSFSAATGGNEWSYEVIDEGSCSWLHDMGPILSKNKANMPTVMKVIQWKRSIENIGGGALVSSVNLYGLTGNQYWPRGNHPSGPIKRRI